MRLLEIARTFSDRGRYWGLARLKIEHKTIILHETYRIVRVFSQYICQQFWHELFHGVWVTVYQGTHTEDGRMSLSNG
jgi:hypothetical protein